MPKHKLAMSPALHARDSPDRIQPPIHAFLAPPMSVTQLANPSTERVTGTKPSSAICQV
ncbi:hypothetical protein K3556_12895 [Aliiroseovarius sp. M344]|uniref:hypothetical protein n=1 Tax=Aliiroseovarius sp. M344 TaxID=2867010 RepID=UPI0021AD5511|nr:hypothetical protein [Aliiroseovarius sp. M344]UWQ13816.1 hypothetical protein K3556_12895 [Aliiroseovarius sp. M344]